MWLPSRKKIEMHVTRYTTPIYASDRSERVSKKTISDTLLKGSYVGSTQIDGATLQSERVGDHADARKSHR